MAKNSGSRAKEVKAFSTVSFNRKTIEALTRVAMISERPCGERGFFTTAKSSFRQKIITARAVAEWRHRSKLSEGVTPKSLAMSKRCPLLDTGRNSVAPCTSPIINA